MQKRHTDMLNGVIWKEILLFFFPIMFGSLFQQLYNTVDAMVVGNFVGTGALAAVGGSTGTVINLLVGFVVGLTSGATVVIAQAYGGNDLLSVRKGVSSGVLLAALMGIGMTILGITAAPYILHLLQVPEDIYGLSLQYMQIYMAGLLPTMLFNTGAGILRAVGDSKRPLYFLIAATVINIVFDILFVAVMGFGIAGAAWATVLAQSVSGILTMVVLADKDAVYHFDYHLKADWKMIAEIIRIGLPMGVQSVLYCISNLFIQVAVNGFGTATIAAWTAFGKIDALFWNYSNSLGTAVLTFIGQNYGAGNIRRLHKGVRTSIVMYVIISAAITLFSLAAGSFLYRLFTPEADVISIGMEMLKNLAPFWSTFCFVEILSQTMRACGNSFGPTLITGLAVAVLRIIWIVLIPHATVFHALACYPVTWITASIVFIIYYVTGLWKRRITVKTAETK